MIKKRIYAVACFVLGLYIHPVLAANAAEQDSIDQIFTTYESSDAPGCSVAVYQNGEILESRGYGLANLEHDVPNAPDTVFRIASTSKQFTAAAIAMLAADEHLSLDDDIRKFFPQLPRYEKKVTVGHLIHHTSGLRDYLWLAWAADWGETYTVDQTLRLIFRQQGTHFPPGTMYEYSNTGYLLLAHIVESVTGQTLRAWADENIFAPLGMENTHFHDDYTHVVKNRATGYAADKNGGYVIDSPEFNHVGDAGILTTIEDLLPWDSNFYDNQLTGSKELTRQLETPGKLDGGEALSYAFGLYVDEFNGVREISHSGGYAGFQSSMNRYPDHQLTVVVLCNDAAAMPYLLARRVAGLYLGHEILESSIEAPSPDKPGIYDLDIEHIVGDYINESSAAVVSIVSDGKSLFYTNPAGQRFRLGSHGDGGFLLEDIPFRVHITFDSNGSQTHSMIVEIEDQDPVAYRRFVPFIPGEERLPEFAGSYYGAELDYDLDLVVTDSAISAVRRNGLLPLQPLERDTFVFGDGIVLEFNRGESGQIDGLVMHAYGIRNLSFEKH